MDSLEKDDDQFVTVRNYSSVRCSGEVYSGFLREVLFNFEICNSDFTETFQSFDGSYQPNIFQLKQADTHPLLSR
jgi:hypothetical protein